jgi:alpha-beta hydrolase superfamily lysophospholipase
LLSRKYITRYGNGLKGVILSGTTASAGILGSIATFLAKRECRKNGRKAPSELLNSMVFGSFNKPYKPARTDFEWLSRDPQQVDLYVDDPYCGGVFTAGFFFDFFTGLKEMFQTANTLKVPKDLPIYIFSGEMDPVGGKNGKMVRKTSEIYKKVGVKDVELKLYADARHEMLNEINKEDVYQDVIQWLNNHLEID